MSIQFLLTVVVAVAILVLAALLRLGTWAIVRFVRAARGQDAQTPGRARGVTQDPWLRPGVWRERLGRLGQAAGAIAIFVVATVATWTRSGIEKLKEHRSPARPDALRR